MRDLSVALVGSAFYSVMEAGCYFPPLALKQVQTATTTHEGQTAFPLLPLLDVHANYINMLSFTIQNYVEKLLFRINFHFMMTLTILKYFSNA